jgi:hypothetical protein
MKRCCKIGAAAAIAGLAIGASGCGRTDGNRAAVLIVARAFLDAYASHDAATVCRVITPPLATSFAYAGGGSCERHVASTFAAREAPAALGPVTIDGGKARVAVPASPTRFVGLLHFGSIWRVTESWQLR